METLLRQARAADETHAMAVGGVDVLVVVSQHHIDAVHGPGGEDEDGDGDTPILRGGVPFLLDGRKLFSLALNGHKAVAVGTAKKGTELTVTVYGVGEDVALPQLTELVTVDSDLEVDVNCTGLPAAAVHAGGSSYHLFLGLGAGNLIKAHLDLSRGGQLSKAEVLPAMPSFAAQRHFATWPSNGAPVLAVASSPLGPSSYVLVVALQGDAARGAAAGVQTWVVHPGGGPGRLPAPGASLAVGPGRACALANGGAVLAFAGSTALYWPQTPGPMSALPPLGVSCQLPGLGSSLAAVPGETPAWVVLLEDGELGVVGPASDGVVSWTRVGALAPDIGGDVALACAHRAGSPAAWVVWATAPSAGRV